MMIASTYTEFLDSKRQMVKSTGIDVEQDAIHGMIFPFQRQLVQWTLRKGRVALFADTGLGKTLMQLEWVRLKLNQALRYYKVNQEPAQTLVMISII